MAKVVLMNRTRRPRRMLVLNLTKEAAPVVVENRTVETNKRGESLQRVSKKIVPAALRVPHGKTVQVDPRVLKCPEVARALKARDLVVVEG